MRHNESTLWNAYALNPSKKGTLQSLCARMGKIISGEGEILTGVERVVMGTNGTILLKSPNKSHITKNLENSSFLENSRRFSTPSQMELLLSVFVDLFRHPFLNITF